MVLSAIVYMQIANAQTPCPTVIVSARSYSALVNTAATARQQADSLCAATEQRADAMCAAVMQLADSICRETMQLADSISDAAGRRVAQTESAARAATRAADSLRVDYCRLVLSQPYDPATVTRALHAYGDITCSDLREDALNLNLALTRYRKDNAELLKVLRKLQNDRNRVKIRDRDSFVEKGKKAIKSTKAYAADTAEASIPVLHTVIIQAIDRLENSLSPNPPADFSDLIDILNVPEE